MESMLGHKRIRETCFFLEQSYFSKVKKFITQLPPSADDKKSLADLNGMLRDLDDLYEMIRKHCESPKSPHDVLFSVLEEIFSSLRLPSDEEQFVITMRVLSDIVIQINTFLPAPS